VLAIESEENPALSYQLSRGFNIESGHSLFCLFSGNAFSEGKTQ
jgi:hypothetical protein